jgi:hypothetical protein
MTKEQRSVIAEYINSLSDDMLGNLTAKLVERVEGDLAEALDFMGRNNKMDSLLSSAKSATELYDMSDQVRDMFLKECKRKGVAPMRYSE